MDFMRGPGRIPIEVEPLLFAEAIDWATLQRRRTAVAGAVPSVVIGRIDWVMVRSLVLLWVLGVSGTIVGMGEYVGLSGLTVSWSW
jgi:hypothetical protein